MSSDNEKTFTFDGKISSFPSWCDKMLGELHGVGAAGIAQGTDDRPDASRAAAREKWDLREGKGLRALIRHLPDSEISSIVRIGKLRDAWLYLEKTYGGGVGNKELYANSLDIQLSRLITRVGRNAPTEKITETILKGWRIIDKLRDLKFYLTDELAKSKKRNFLMSCLHPTDHNSFITSYERSSENMSPDDLLGYLRAHLDRNFANHFKRRQNPHGKPERANAARANGKNPKNSKFQSRKGPGNGQPNKKRSHDDALEAALAAGTKYCTNCNRPGHVKADCCRPGGGKEGQWDSIKKSRTDQGAAVRLGTDREKKDK